MSGPFIQPRVIPVEADEADALPLPPLASGAARRGIDYAALLRRARLLEQDAALRRRRARMHEETPAPPATTSDAEVDGAVASAPPEDETTADDDESLPCAHSDTAARSRARKLEELAQPFLVALTRQQARVAHLMHFLATRVADFCTDEAVLANGNWTIVIKLNEALLPACTLHLTLSYFDLVLRFETPDDLTRQLIFSHRTLLADQLVALLNRLDAPRQVSIEMW